MHIRKDLEERLNELALAHGIKNGAQVANECLWFALEIWEAAQIIKETYLHQKTQNACDRAIQQIQELRDEYVEEAPQQPQVEEVPQRRQVKREVPYLHLVN